MKHFVSLVLTLAVAAATLPAACAAESSGKWKAVAGQCEELGLQVAWYPEYEGLMRRYGTDRMLLVEAGQSYLCKLNDNVKLAGPFDAFGEFNKSGLAPACQNGKWGMVDRDGKAVVDFVHPGQYEAELAGEDYPEFRDRDGKDAPPYALVKMDGTLLTGYDFWAYRPFVNGFAMVTDGTSGWGFVDIAGRAITGQKYSAESLNDAKMGGDEFGPDGYAIVINADLKGYNIINSRGEELLAKPSYIKPWRAGHGLWGYEDRDSCKVGFMDGEGRVVIQPQYMYMKGIKGYRMGYEFNESGIAHVYTEDSPEGYDIDLGGNRMETISAAGKDAAKDTDWYEGLKWRNARGDSVFAGDAHDGPWGFMNEAGEQMVPAIFDAVGYFDYGYATVMVDGVFGLLANPLELYQTIDAFEKATGGKLDVTWVNTDHALVALSADQLIAERKLMGYSGPKVSIATPYYDYGLLDLAGRRLVPTIYGHSEYGGLISGKRFGFFTGKRSQDGNSVVYADLLGNEFTPEDIREELEFDTVCDYGSEHPYYYGNDWTNEQLVPGRFDNVGYFTDGVGVVSLDGASFVIDRTGETLFTIDPEVYSEYDDEFHEGLLKVKDKTTGKWGAVDKTGKLVIPCQWGAMSRFGEGLACVRETEDGKEGYINTAGELLMPCILDGYNAPNIWYEPDVLIAVEYQGQRGVWRNPTRKDKVSDWAKAEVTAAAEAGYVTESCKAYQTYAINREQFASLAVNYLEKKTGQAIVPAPADAFTDTADEAVLKAYAAGIVQGMGDGVFGPGRPLSREQLATMLWRAMNKAGMTAEIPADLTGYSDSPQVSKWAEESLSALIGLEVMVGTGGNSLSPKASCTVEQAILLVFRAAERGPF